MESAGKRNTHPPKYLNDYILDLSEFSTMAANTTTVNTSTISTHTIKTSIKPISSESTAGNAEPSIQQMFTQMMKALKKSTEKSEESIAAITAAVKDTRKEIIEHREETTKQNEQCIQRWQETDIRITKLEDDHVHQDFVDRQDIINEQTTRRIVRLEEETINIKRDLSKLVSKFQTNSPNDVSQIHASTILSSTNTVPICSTHLSSSNLQPVQETLSMSQMPIPYDQSKSSYFGSQERLQDAVSEFSGPTKSLHPETFIRQLDIYFENVFLSPSQKLISAQRRLSGDARIWYESLIPVPEDYPTFRSLFRQRFWSAATQRKVRNDIFRPFQYNTPGGITTHAMSWIAKAKFLEPPIDQYDLVGIIIQHYPSTLGMAIRGRGPKTTNELLSILTEFEESTSFCDVLNNRPRPFNERRGQSNNFHRNGYRGGYNGGQVSNTHQDNPVVVPVNQINVSGNSEEDRA